MEGKFEATMETGPQEWFEDSAPLSDIEVSKFEELCGELYHQKNIIGELKDRLKDENAILTKMKGKILGYLDQFKKDNYKSEYGTVYKITKFSVKTPKTSEDKRALRDWLEKLGIDEQYLGVNSASLNSLYKSQLEAEGPDFQMPGVEAPTHYEELGLRGKK